MLRTLILAAFVLALAGCGGGSSSAPAPKSEPPAPAAKAAAPTTAPPTAAAKAAAPTSAPAATLAPAAQVEAVALGEPVPPVMVVYCDGAAYPLRSLRQLVALVRWRGASWPRGCHTDTDWWSEARQYEWQRAHPREE